MSKKDDEIIQACRLVIERHEAFLAAEKEHIDWTQNDEEYGGGSIKVRYDFRDGQLQEAAQEAYEDYERSIASLKSLLA